MSEKISHKSLLIPSLIWLGVLAATLLGASLRGLGIGGLWPLALIASVPALLGILLIPALRQEWAQIIVMFAWAGLAILASASLGFVPMALMFLCVPAIAMLFFKEKVIEALVIAAILAALVYFAGREGYIPDAPLSAAQELWGRQTGLMGTIALVIGSMFAGSQPRGAAMLPTTDSRPKESWQDGIKGGLLEFDAEDNLVSTNPNAADLFGLDQAIGRVRLGNLLDFNKERQEDLSAFAALARRQGKPQSLRLTLPGRENDLTHLDMYLTPLTSKGLILHAVDRTDDESRIETLRRSQNSAQRDSEDKTLFFAGVSHELRTPLNAIIGFSDMMRSRLFGPLPGKYAEYADLIHDSGQHMLDLIGDVLDLSKVEAGKYELHYDHFDASDVVRSSVKMIRPAADAAQVVLDVDLPHDTGVLVQADRRAVRQILLNLLSNAVKFSNKGGHISVSAAQAASNLILSVGDEGPGMSADEIARIGEPYAQGAQSNMVNERGTGLGLSLVKSLTELHGGSMDIESALGAGTTVKISLPLEAS